MVNEMDKTYFAPGDLCMVKHEIPNRPVMVVQRIERSLMRSNEHNILRGLRCRWFTKDGYLQEAVFSTKDLIKV